VLALSRPLNLIQALHHIAWVIHSGATLVKIMRLFACLKHRDAVFNSLQPASLPDLKTQRIYKNLANTVTSLEWQALFLAKQSNETSRISAWKKNFQDSPW